MDLLRSTSDPRCPSGFICCGAPTARTTLGIRTILSSVSNSIGAESWEAIRARVALLSWCTRRIFLHVMNPLLPSARSKAGVVRRRKLSSEVTGERFDGWQEGAHEDLTLRQAQRGLTPATQSFGDTLSVRPEERRFLATRLEGRRDLRESRRPSRRPLGSGLLRANGNGIISPRNLRAARRNLAIVVQGERIRPGIRRHNCAGVY